MPSPVAAPVGAFDDLVSAPAHAGAFDDLVSAPSAGAFDDLVEPAPAAARPIDDVEVSRDLVARAGRGINEGLGAVASGLGRLKLKASRAADAINQAATAQLPDGVFKRAVQATNRLGITLATGGMVDPTDTMAKQSIAAGEEAQRNGQFYQPNAALDNTLKAKAVDFTSRAAPVFLTGPAAPLVGGVQMGEFSLQDARRQGLSEEEQNRRFDINTAGGTALGLIPLPFVNRVGNRLLRTGAGALAGGAVNAAGDVGLQYATTGDVNPDSVAQSALIGAFGGAAHGLTTEARVPKPKVELSPAETKLGSALSDPDLSSDKLKGALKEFFDDAPKAGTAAPVEFIGGNFFENGEWVRSEAYRATDDIPALGIKKGDTVDRSQLEKAGYQVPEASAKDKTGATPPPNPIAPVEYLGNNIFENKTTGEKIRQETFRATEDIPQADVVKGGTIGRDRLEAIGYHVPETPVLPDGHKVEMPIAAAAEARRVQDAYNARQAELAQAFSQDSTDSRAKIAANDEVAREAILRQTTLGGAALGRDLASERSGLQDQAAAAQRARDFDLARAEEAKVAPPLPPKRDRRGMRQLKLVRDTAETPTPPPKASTLTTLGELKLSEENPEAGFSQYIRERAGKKPTTLATLDLKPLPDDARITVMEMGGKRATSVEIPAGPGERPTSNPFNKFEAPDTTGIPQGTYTAKQLRDLRLLLKEEPLLSNATQERQRTQGNLGEHPQADRGGLPTETGGRDSTLPSGEIKGGFGSQRAAGIETPAERLGLGPRVGSAASDIRAPRKQQPSAAPIPSVKNRPPPPLLPGQSGGAVPPPPPTGLRAPPPPPPHGSIPSAPFKRPGFVSDLLSPISTRIRNISSELYGAMQKYETRIRSEAQRYRGGVVPFLKDTRKLLSRADQVELGTRLFNGDMAGAEQLIESYRAKNPGGVNETLRSFDQARSVYKELLQKARDVGIETGEIENYWPREVKRDSLEEFLNHLGVQDKGPINDAIKAKEEQMGRKLNLDERVDTANQVLKNQHIQAVDTRPGQFKERGVQTITPDLVKYYENHEKSGLDYIDRVVNNIEKRRLFGKDPNHITGSMGAIAERLRNSGQLSGAAQSELSKLLNARFTEGEQGSNKFVRTLRTLGYTATLGSPFSAISQLADLGLVAYREGAWGTVKAVFGKKQFTLEDIGLHNIGHEFTTQGRTQKALDRVFTAVGFNKVDRIGKEAMLNAGYSALKRNSHTAAGIAKLTREWQPIFGQEFPQFLNDLQRGVKNSDNVKMALLNKVCDIQPVTLSEMPLKYLQNPNGRLFYMLKTFTLKQLDLYRRDIAQEFAKGNHGTAIKNMVRAGVYLGAAGAGTSLVKDFMLNRPIDPEDYTVTQALSLLGLTKYQVKTAQNEGVGQALVDSISPPVSIASDIQKDLANLDEVLDDPTQARSLKYVPVVGKFLYWTVGKGSEK